LFQREDFMRKGRNAEALSWVQVPVRMGFVAWKLSLIEEWC
jgi:hypothetical protein